MKFYQKLKTIIVYAECIFICALFFVFFNYNNAIDLIIVSAINLLSAVVCVILITYYKNRIFSIEICKDDTIKMQRFDGKIISKKRQDCLKIDFGINNTIVLIFIDNIYKVNKYINISKTPAFDFSILNSSNFPNAEILNYNSP